MTIREIAIECGVSVATVDRVINKRGKVRPETEARIAKILEQSGYSKNIAARALAIRKDYPTIGVLVSSEGNPFFDEVLAGIRRAQAELTDLGVSLIVRTMHGYCADTQLKIIDELTPSISALVLHPIDDPRIVSKISELQKNNIPTITINSDLEHSVRLCYVGSDYMQGGQTAAGLMCLATQGKRQLGILTGVDTILGHRQRLRGFEEYLTKTCSRIRIIARASAEDDDYQAYLATLKLLRNNPRIDTLQLIAAGLHGVCEAVLELKKNRCVCLFAFDQIPATEAAMKNGFLKAVVSQQPFEQGYQAIRAAQNVILTGSPVNEKVIMENQIYIYENLKSINVKAGKLDKI